MFESKSHTVVIGAMQKGILSEFLSTPETVPFYMWYILHAHFRSNFTKCWWDVWL